MNIYLHFHFLRVADSIVEKRDSTSRVSWAGAVTFRCGEEGSLSVRTRVLNPMLHPRLPLKRRRTGGDLRDVRIRPRCRT